MKKDKVLRFLAALLLLIISWLHTCAAMGLIFWFLGVTPTLKLTTGVWLLLTFLKYEFKKGGEKNA